MDVVRRERLAAVMAALRDDDAAVVTLFWEFGDDIGRVVGFIARSQGRDPGEDELHELTMEACFAIAAVAGGWRPDGGALPWVWGRRRIEQAVLAALGPGHSPLPAGYDTIDDGGVAAVSGDTTALAALDALAAGDARCAQLRDLLRASIAPADAEVLLRYRVQQQAGDPSPAHTVGRELGLQPPAVRQRASRARRRLAAAAAACGSEELAGLALLRPSRLQEAAA